VAIAAALAHASDHLSEPAVQAGLMCWIIATYVLGGLVAWRRTPESRFGPLMIAAGFVAFLSALWYSNVALAFTFGQVLDLVPAAVLLHVFLAYPTGRLERPAERALVVAAYVIALAPVPARMALGGFGPDNLLELTSDPGANLVVTRIELVALSATLVAGVGLLLIRRRGAGWAARRWPSILIDSFSLSLVMLAFLFATAAFGEHGFTWIQRATLFVIGLAPVAFLAGLLHARLARSALGALIVELRDDPAPADLRDALARALRDPSLELAFWLPEYGAYADEDGQPAAIPEPDAGRAVTPVEQGGERVAALVHDPSLLDEPELLVAVTAAAGIAIDSARLHAELRARLDELRGSRARVIEAGRRERERLERNLHDGAQQRLVALSLELGMLQQRVGDDPDATRRLERARLEIATSLGELREIARGIHPAVVTSHGLAVALEQLAANAPVPVRLRVALDRRLPQPLEVAAYYIVSESLANAGKHARASEVSVEVARRGDQVLIEVLDDGVGGADSERGSGLRGMADRVEALDGRLRVWSPRGGGTRMKAEIPCGL
jgi:signal transduction histidine kinase